MAGWIIGIFMTIIAILGLIMSSRAVDSTFAWVGIIFFVAAVSYIYNQISRNIN